MSRKDYPFSRRDVNSGTKLVSGILGSILAIPFSGGGGLFDIDIHSEEITPKVIKPKWLFIKNIIIGICLLLSPILGYILYSQCYWWPIFILLVCIVCVLLFGIPIIIIEEYLTRYSLFEKDIFINQVLACIKVLKFWRIVVTVQFANAIALTVIILSDASFISLMLSILYICLNILCLVQGYRAFPMFYGYLVRNNSFKECVGNIETILTPSLRKLYDGELEMSELEFTNGCIINVVANDDWKKSGFEIVNPNGSKKQFLLGAYSNMSKLQIHERTVVFREITKDINDELMIVEARKIIGLES